MKKILIVDDHLEIRRLVEITLRDDGYQILQAESGQEAIEKQGVEKPDLMIMDVVMPGKIDGIEATRILKKDPENNVCPIIMLTSKGQDDDIEKGYNAGADNYLVKPFSPLELINKVEELLA